MAMITERLTYVNLDGHTLQEVVAWLGGYSATYQLDYENLRFEEQDNEYGEGKCLYLLGDRPETDSERVAREKREKADNERRIAYRRAEYARLKKEFGDS
jgi:hypothetical protein